MKKNKLLRIIASILCIALFLPCFACNEPVEEQQEEEKRYSIVEDEYLYRGGVSEYCVLIRDEANYYEDFASTELVQILSKATGNSIPIVTESNLKNKDRVISLGHTSLWDEKVGKTLSSADIIDSGYYIETVENNVYISCPDNTSSSGVLYGVYDFLHDIVNYEFYAVTEVQYDKTKEIPLVSYEGLTINPSFEMRQIRNADLRDDKLTTMRYRMVYPSTSFGMATWGHGQVSQYIYPDAKCTCGEEGCEGKTFQQHHPDWFAGYGTPDMHLCWSAGEILVRETAKRFIQYFEQYPDADYFMFGQEDNQEECECQRCKDAMASYALNHTGLQIAFMNDVIKITNEWLNANQPGRRVKYVIYAYYGTQHAPVVKQSDGTVKEYNDRVVPVDDLYIFYAPIFANFAYQIESSLNTDVYNDLKEWSVIASGQMIMYLYDINFRCYFVNFNNFGTAKGMYEICKELGVSCMTSQAADSYTACFQEMRSYVESALMWDLSLSYDDLVVKFMKAYYKDAWESIYEYYQIIRDRYAYYLNYLKPQEGGIYGDIISTELWTQPIIEKIDVLFDKALQDIVKYQESDPELYVSLQTRIMKERLTPIYLKMVVLSAYYSTEELAEMKATFTYYVNLFKFTEEQEGVGLEGLIG